MLKLYIFVTFFSLVWSTRHPDGTKYTECSPTEIRCEFWLVIREALTMIFHKDLVYADKGNLYLYNEHPGNYTTEVSFTRVQNA